MTGNYARLQQGIVAAERVFNVMDVEPWITSKPDALTFSSLNEGIRLENVVFSYENADRNAIDGINLNIPKGKTFALVGRSGAVNQLLPILLSVFMIPLKAQLKLMELI